MKYRMFFIGVVLFGLLPAISHAQGPTVLLSEIAWMGSNCDPTQEWIELYNLSDTNPIDLTGWTVTSADGAIAITLSGTLPAPHGVVLLERGNDNVIPGIAALQTFNGELNDAGTTVTLKNSEGTIIDIAVGGANWTGIGGSNTLPKKTSQRNRRGGWVTAAATPGLDNAQVSDVVDATTASSTLATLCPTTLTSSTVTSGRSGGGSSKKNSEPTITVMASSTSYYAGKPMTFTTGATKSTKTRDLGLTHYWNFGDAQTSTGTKVSHIYDFPGEYIVMVESSSTRKKSLARLDITVLPHALALSASDEGNIVITNVSDAEFKLDGYTVSGEDFELVFPKNSLLKSKASITIAQSKVGASTILEIIDLDDYVIARLALKKGEPLTASTVKPTVAKTLSSSVTKVAPIKVSTAQTNTNGVRKSAYNNYVSVRDTSTEPEPRTASTKPSVFDRALSRLARVMGF